MTTRLGCREMPVVGNATVSLAALLQSATPREQAGSRTAGRYDFQSHYAILRIVELQSSSGDFCLVCDLFDDLVVLDSLSDPKEVRLYQIKSKDPGHWTCANLCKQLGATKPKSIVARLYAHIDIFGDSVKETGFVSNASFALKLNDGTETDATHIHILGSKLHTSEVAKIQKAITEDIPKNDTPAWLPKLTLIRTGMSVAGQEPFVVGVLQTHIENKYGVAGVKVQALYETLLRVVDQRFRYESKTDDAANLVARKSLSRDQIDALFNTAVKRRESFIENWHLIASDLEKAGVGSAVQLKLNSLCSRFAGERAAGLPVATALDGAVTDWIGKNEDAIAGCDAVLDVVELMQKDFPTWQTYTKDQLRAALIVEAYEAINAIA